jgi:hypothetical protein
MISQRRTTAGRGWTGLLSWIFILVLSHLSPARGLAVSHTDITASTAAAPAITAASGPLVLATAQPAPLPDGSQDFPGEIEETSHEPIADTGSTPQPAALRSSRVIHRLIPRAGARTDVRQPSASWTACVVPDFRGPPSA